VQVAPASGSFPTAATIAFTATALDDANTVFPNTPFDWTINDATLGTISSKGLFTPSGKGGTLTVRAATPKGLAGSATVTLLEPSVPTLIAIVSGDAQTDTVQKTLANPFVVKVTDQRGDPLAGVTVAWTRLTGEGTLATATSTTDAAGLASVSYSLGGAAGTETVRASVSGLSATVTFSATAIARPTAPAQIEIVSGNTQTDTIRKQLASPLVVRITTAAGEPLSGITVNWTRLSGAGSVASATSVTSASGLASITYTLGDTPGAESIRASVSGLTPTVTFSATAVAGAPAAIALVSGSAQTDTVLKALQNTFVVKVTDVAGNLRQGIVVNWTRLTGNGTPGSATSTTDASGLASMQYTLGAIMGSEVVRASVDGLTPTVSFTATAVAGKPAVLAIISGNAQIDTILKTLPLPFVVKVSDASGNPVSGASVTWTRIGGFGSPTDSTTSTDADGLASLSYRLGDIGGADTVRAAVAGIVPTVTFTAGVRDGLGQPIVTGFAYLRVLPSPVSPRVGDTLVFTADSISASGQATRVTAQWASNQPGRGAIDATGRMIIADTGSIVVTATRNGMTGHARVTALPAPKLTGFSFSPRTLNGITNAALTTSFTFSVLDAGTGITTATVTITGPTGVTKTCTVTTPTTGTARNGVFDCAMTLPLGSAPGAWQVTSLVLNGSITRTYGASALATFGSTTLTVNP
jgi:adhesin/invasin